MSMHKGFIIRDVNYTSLNGDIPKFTDIKILRTGAYKSLVSFKYEGIVTSAWVNNTDIALNMKDVMINTNTPVKGGD